MTFPGNIKSVAAFFRPLLPSPIPAADTWTFQHERVHSTLDYCFFRPFLHPLLLSPKSTGPRNFWLNAKFMLNYLQLSFLLTAQRKTSSQAAIKTFLLELINILTFIFYFLPFNITRGNNLNCHFCINSNITCLPVIKLYNYGQIICIRYFISYKVSKVGYLRRGWPEGSLFNNYDTEV